jgi:hypothetical protein
MAQFQVYDSRAWNPRHCVCPQCGLIIHAEGLWCVCTTEASWPAAVHRWKEATWWLLAMVVHRLVTRWPRLYDWLDRGK